MAENTIDLADIKRWFYLSSTIRRLNGDDLWDKMGRNGKKHKHLTKAGSDSLLEAKRNHAAEREQRVAELRECLADEYRHRRNLPEGTPIPAADSVVLASAVSASFEIERTTAQLVAGRAQQKALDRLGFARSELRRCLRSLGMVGDSGEQREEQSGPTLDDLKAEYRERAAAGATK